MIPNFTVDFNSVQIEGKTYIAKPHENQTCNGCAFDEEGILFTPECRIIHTFCFSDTREDKQDVIWILKEEKGN